MTNTVQRIRTLETSRQRAAAGAPFTIITVSGVYWDTDTVGKPVCVTPEAAVYKHEGAVVTKNDAGRWCYENGDEVLVPSGYVVTVREDHIP